MEEQWDWLKQTEAAAAQKQVVIVTPVDLISLVPVSARKWKSTAKQATAGSLSTPGRGKKTKPGLTIEDSLNFTKDDLSKMDKKEVNSIGEIITKVFDSVFVNDMNALTPYN